MPQLNNFTQLEWVEPPRNGEYLPDTELIAIIEGDEETQEAYNIVRDSIKPRHWTLYRFRREWVQDPLVGPLINRWNQIVAIDNEIVKCKQLAQIDLKLNPDIKLRNNGLINLDIYNLIYST